jgi:hypothetical protein
VEGRVFRNVDERWEPIGDPLPTWDHVPPRPNQDINVWVLPNTEGYQVGDVIAFGETGHRLLALVPTDDVAWDDVVQSALAMHPAEHVRQWTHQIELWLGMRLSSWR